MVNKKDGRLWIGHNEDGDPFLFQKCFLIDVQFDDGSPGFLSFE